MPAQTALPLQANGSLTLVANGSVPLVDPTADDCCCQCPACVDDTTRLGQANACDLCNSGGTDTPLTWVVTIPAQVLSTGCHGPCDLVTAGAPPDGSWNLTGSYAGGTYCLMQIAPCLWGYDAAFAGAVLTGYDDAGCTGTATATTDRISVLLNFDIATNFLSVAVVIYASGGGGAFPAEQIALFDGGIFPTLDPGEKICCNGADIDATDPSILDPDCPLAADNAIAVYTTVTTARIDPCCP